MKGNVVVGGLTFPHSITALPSSTSSHQAHLHRSSQMSAPPPGPTANPPATFPEKCNRLLIAWRDCHCVYGNTNDILPCYEKVTNKSCSFSGLKRMPDPNRRHTEMLSTGEMTGFCRDCRPEDEGGKDGKNGKGNDGKNGKGNDGKGNGKKTNQGREIDALFKYRPDQNR
jgi:hypothetical protein